MRTKKKPAAPKAKPAEVKPEGLRGNELLRAAWNQIFRNPKSWRQTDWHCGTSHCFGGWCQILSGAPLLPGNSNDSDDANKANEAIVLMVLKQYAGLSQEDAEHICDPHITLKELYWFIRDCIDQEPREL